MSSLEENALNEMNELMSKLFSRNSLLFLFFSIFTSFIGISVSSGFFNLPKLGVELLIQLQATGMVIAWICISLSSEKANNKNLFLIKDCFKPAFLIASVMVMFLTIFEAWRTYAFWFMLIVWLYIIQAEMSKKAGRDNLSKIISLSTVLGVGLGIVTIGTIPFFGYSKEATDALSSFHFLLDIRLVFAFVFLALIVGLAFRLSIKEALPPLPKFRKLSLKTPSARGLVGSVVKSFMIPFLAILNIVLAAVSAVVDFLWKISTVIGIYLTRVGKYSAKIIKEIVIDKGVGLQTLKYLGFFVCALAIVLLSKSSVSYALAYILSSEWSTELINLLYLILLVIILIPLVGLSCAFLVDSFKWLYQQVAFGLAMMLSVLLTAGIIIYAVSRIEYFMIAGFEGIGPYTAIMLLLVVLGGVASFILESKSAESSSNEQN